MFPAYLVVTLLAIAANAFSGVAALVHFKPIVPGMVKAGVPESWLTFPIGTLKTAGAVGLLLGLIGVPLIGTAAAIGLVLFFVCAVYTHVRARDYSLQFGLAIGFLSLAVATLVLGLAWSSEAEVADAQPPRADRFPRHRNTSGRAAAAELRRLRLPGPHAPAPGSSGGGDARVGPGLAADGADALTSTGPARLIELTWPAASS